MVNIKSFTVNNNDAGKRLDKFVTKAAPKLPTALMYKYVRLKRIKLNGKRAQISDKLKVGDTVDMYVAIGLLRYIEVAQAMGTRSGLLQFIEFE